MLPRWAIFAADVLRATGRELRAAHPLFGYTLPPRALPHSVVVGAHTIVCVRDAAASDAVATTDDDARVLVLSRALAEEGRPARVRRASSARSAGWSTPASRSGWTCLAFRGRSS